MSFVEPLLFSVEDVLLLYLFSLLPLLKQALLVPTVEALLASLAILEAMAVVPVASHYSVLGLVAPGSITPYPFFFPLALPPMSI